MAFSLEFGLKLKSKTLFNPKDKVTQLLGCQILICCSSHMSALRLVPIVSALQFLQSGILSLQPSKYVPALTLSAVSSRHIISNARSAFLSRLRLGFDWPWCAFTNYINLLTYKEYSKTGPVIIQNMWHVTCLLRPRTLSQCHLVLRGQSHSWHRYIFYVSLKSIQGLQSHRVSKIHYFGCWFS